MSPSNLCLAAVACVAFLARPARAAAKSKAEIDALVREAVHSLYQQSSAARELGSKAEGMLVFPSVVKGAFIVGGLYGEGALVVGGRNVAYYSTAAASIGFQWGGASMSQVILFMTPQALRQFRESEGWKVGVDANVAIATLGAGGAIDTETIRKPIIGFVFGSKGLMAGVSLEGSKITRIEPK